MLPTTAGRRNLAIAVILLFRAASLVAAAEPISVPPAALAFAAEHHPELVPLLERLNRDAPAEFKAAIADLEKTRERLAKLSDQQPERQAAALAEWKLSSRIRLSLARLATNLSPEAEAEAELRELVATRARNRAAGARAERERIAAHLERLTDQLADFDRDPEAAIAREFETVRAKAVRGGKRNKPGPAAGGKKPQARNPAADNPAAQPGTPLNAQPGTPLNQEPIPNSQ
ncbi:MAG: hypothetical protein WED27_11790 [Pirellulales bacterium]